MKKVAWGIIVALIIGYLVLSSDPLNEVVNFIIAGSIPGTTVSIGFWSTMLLVGIFMIVIYRAVKNAQHKMIVSEVQKAKTSKAEDESSEITFDHTKRSVIAARN